jgi:hypothetical protein
MGQAASSPADRDVRKALDAFRRLVQALRLPGTGRGRGPTTAQLFALRRIADASRALGQRSGGADLHRARAAVSPVAARA